MKNILYILALLVCFSSFGQENLLDAKKSKSLGIDTSKLIEAACN